MATLKQEAITEMLKLPDTASLDDMRVILEKVRLNNNARKRKPQEVIKVVNECYGSLGTGRRTDDILAGLRGDL